MGPMSAKADIVKTGDAALERAKLAEDQRRELEVQLATKDFELDAANKRADLAEKEYHAALGVLNPLRRFHGYPNTPLNRARRFDAEDEGGDNANARVSVQGGCVACLLSRAERRRSRRHGMRVGARAAVSGGAFDAFGRMATSRS